MTYQEFENFITKAAKARWDDVKNPSTRNRVLRLRIMTKAIWEESGRKVPQHLRFTEPEE
jgi:hypothetical protein